MLEAAWRRRRARVVALTTAHPHAAALLTFYGQVLELQEAIARTVEPSAWLAAAEDRDVACLRVDHLSVDRHIQEFRQFVQAIGDLGVKSTEVLTAVARRLAEPDTIAAHVLRTFVSHGSLDQSAETLGCVPVTLEFFPRAFIQPVTEVLAAHPERADTRDPDTAAARVAPETCPRCGSLPQIALFRDETDVKGRRALQCALCATEWAFRRATCPYCGETDTEQLQYHAADRWPHVRVEECRRCATYIKAIDLRVDGLAVPLVDEVASVELDLWAEESNLRKVQHNLVGL